MIDIIIDIRESKHSWEGHVARRHDYRWTIRVTELLSGGNKRPQFRPSTRWWDDLHRHVIHTWSHTAKDRKSRKACTEEFLLMETEIP